MSKQTRIRNLWLVYLAGDVLAIVAAYHTAVAVRFVWGTGFFDWLNVLLSIRESGALAPELRLFYEESAPRIIPILSGTLCFLFAFFDLYAGRRFILKRPVAWNIILAHAIALAVFFCYFYARRNVFHPRTVFVTVAFFSVAYTVGFRALTDRLLRLARWKLGMDDWPAVLVGAGKDADLLNEYIATVRPHGIRIAERITAGKDEETRTLMSRTFDAVRKHDAPIVICAHDPLDIAEIMLLLEGAENLGADVKVLSEKLNVLVNQARLPLDMIRGKPLVHFSTMPVPRLVDRVKKAGAIVSAAVALVALSPLLLAIGLIVRLTSRGPALFVQERIGVNRRPFRILKFRTMHHLADETQAEVEALNESGAGLFKIRRDPRATAVGRFLRRFSLDELPQLVNVVKGDMTLVGPRPLPRRDFENYYEQWHYTRHGGLPGLTCLWQVSGRSDIDFHNMCILDVYYLRNQNLLLDLKILLKTVIVVLFAKGAY